MAAYHWEARRRQIMLDRQLALQARADRERQKHEEVAGKASQKQPSQVCPDPETQHPALAEGKEQLNMESYQIKGGTTEDRCPCNTNHVPNHSGKLLKRYSDSEYTQQW